MFTHSFTGNIILLASESLGSSLKLHNIDQANGSFSCISVIFKLFTISGPKLPCRHLLCKEARMSRTNGCSGTTLTASIKRKVKSDLL